MFKEVKLKQNTLAGLVCFGLIILAAGIQMSSSNYMKYASNKMLAPLNLVDSIQNQIIENTLKETPLNVRTLKVRTLKKQYLISSEIKGYYMKIGIAYYKNYYAFSICSIIFTTFLTIAVFLIANKGWQNSNLILKSFLLTTIVISSIYYFLPNVLNNKENLKNNLEKVRVFGKIQYDILTLSNKIKQIDSVQIDSAITSNYERISKDLDFMSTIDNSKLQSEYTNLMEQYKPGN